MKFRHFLAAFPLLLVAACGGGDANSNAPAEPVAAVTPPAGQQWTDVVSITPEGGYRMGNPNAPLKLIEYGSRTCPTCGNFGRTGMEPLENQYVKSGKVSYEFRGFIVHGPPDLAASLLGRCVDKSAFFPLLEDMYQQQMQFLEKLEAPEAQQLQQSLQGADPNQVATRWAEYLGYIDFVKQRGVPESQARQCLGDKSKLDEIIKITQEGSDKMHVGGTPTFFLNGEQLQNVVTWDQLEARLKAMGA